MENFGGLARLDRRIQNRKLWSENRSLCFDTKGSWPSIIKALVSKGETGQVLRWLFIFLLIPFTSQIPRHATVASSFGAASANMLSLPLSLSLSSRCSYVCKSRSVSLLVFVDLRNFGFVHHNVRSRKLLLQYTFSESTEWIQND